MSADYQKYLTSIAKLDESGQVKSLRQYVEKLRSELDKKEVGLDLIEGIFKQCYKKPMGFKLAKHSRRKRGRLHETAVVHISDVHFGKKTPRFNFGIAEQRMHKLSEKIIRIADIRRSHSKIEDLRLYFGGDFVEGESIFAGQPHEIDIDLVQQAIFQGPQVIASFILTMLENFDTITIKGVPGNHGRNGTKHSGGNRKVNWDSILYEITRHIVNAAVPDNKIVWDLPFDRVEDWYALDYIGDWGNLLVHGHEVNGQLGFPWYGVGKKVTGWKDVVNYPWDYLYMGHFHTPAHFALNYSEVVASGTLESFSNYVRQNLGGCGWAQQKLLFYTESDGIISSDPIYLDEDRKPKRKR